LKSSKKDAQIRNDEVIKNQEMLAQILLTGLVEEEKKTIQTEEVKI
jgi:hypothetical protein